AHIPPHRLLLCDLLSPGSGHHRDLHSFPTRRSSDLADKAYTGAGAGVIVPFKGRGLTEEKRQHNHVANSTRALVERGFSVFKQWKIFERARCCPTLVGRAAKAVLALELEAQ